MDSNLISAIAWVSKGYALRVPKEYEFDEEEIQEMKKDPLVSKNLQQDLGHIQEQEEDDDDDQDNNMPVFCQEIEALKQSEMGLNNDGYPFAFEDMSDEEKEDFQIKPTDSLIIAAKIENEYSSLEIYIYEEDKANLFVHHEIQLTAFPLALEWLPIQPASIEQTNASRGNFAIVSTFLPEIEIWNLDIVNVLEPTVILGGELEASGKKVKQFKQKNKKYRPGSHTDSVISINLNKFKPNILCSGSADNTVKIWDIFAQKCVYTYEHHTNKLQVTKWNLKEESILLTASQNKEMFLFDARTPKQIYAHTALGDIETAVWDPCVETNIVYSTEQGTVVILDARKFDQEPLAHFISSKKAVSSVSMSSEVPGLLATTNLEGKVSIYDTQVIHENGAVDLIASANPKFNKLYCGQFSQDNPWTFGCGSSMGEIFVWDLTENLDIVERFGKRVNKAFRPKKKECTLSKKSNKAQIEQEQD